MNDEELGRAVGTALSAPRVQPVAGAGSRLRARAHRARVRRSVIAGLATVAVLLAGAGLVRGTGGTAPAPAATGGTSAALLRFDAPVTVGRSSPCTADPGLKCPPAAAVTFDQVREVRTGSGDVVLTLDYLDRHTLNALGNGFSGIRLTARIGGGAALPAAVLDEGEALRIATADPAAALDRLGAHPVQPARLGPGPLDVPLELRAVTRATVGLCPASGPGVVHSGECLVLAGSGLRLRSADLSVRPPVGEDPAWWVVVGVDPADRPGLAAWTRAHIGTRVAFTVGGRPLPELNADALRGAPSTVIELPVNDRVSVDALVSRLRP